jgi:CheY-like chemotaxis protein
MPNGGHLAICTENRCVPAAGAAPAAHFLVISVIDTGIGMDADLQARIFEPYFTTKRDAGGTGIGLGTVRSIATMAGGQVEVSSARGHGTTMRVVLPRADVCSVAVQPRAEAPRIVTPPPIAPVESKRSERKRVLLVEDEHVVRELLQRWLALLGYDVIVATRGAEAFELSAANRGQIDLVLTDLHLPDAKGLAIARGLQDRLPDVPLVVMSGETEQLRAAARDERVAALTKPFSLTELREAIGTALNSAKCPVTP